LYSDTYFFSFKIITFEKFNIEAGRYTSFLSQIIPLILIKLHVGLKAFLIGYSVSIVLVFYGIFLLCLYSFAFWRDWGYSGLNQNYFQLPQEPYAILETPFPGK